MSLHDYATVPQDAHLVRGPDHRTIGARAIGYSIFCGLKDSYNVASNNSVLIPHHVCTVKHGCVITELSTENHGGVR
jgi:hypothetical protein